jgi:hypothetical protein
MLDEQFKRSIIYGMPYDLFWFGDPQDYFVYADAYNEKQKEKDVLNWQLGQYIQFAVGSCLESKCKYPQKPMFYAHEEEKPKDVYDMLERFKGMVAEVNKNFN